MKDVEIKKWVDGLKGKTDDRSTTSFLFIQTNIYTTTLIHTVRRLLQHARGEGQEGQHPVLRLGDRLQALIGHSPFPFLPFLFGAEPSVVVVVYRCVGGWGLHV